MANLHPTLKLCGCGFIGTKKEFLDHIEIQEKMAKFLRVSSRQFWETHGERVLNEGDPRADEYANKKWLEGTPKGYND
jgi:hypothetical protein